MKPGEQLLHWENEPPEQVRQLWSQLLHVPAGDVRTARYFEGGQEKQLDGVPELQVAQLESQF